MEKSEARSEKRELTAKDLALYLGAYCHERRYLNPAPSIISAKKIANLVKDDDVNMCVPILRPLSDMSDAEALKFIKRYHPKALEAFYTEKYNEVIGVMDEDARRLAGVVIDTMIPSDFRFFTIHHFDVFGWIDAGLAIDATALNSNPYNVL